MCAGYNWIRTAKVGVIKNNLRDFSRGFFDLLRSGIQPIVFCHLHKNDSYVIISRVETKRPSRLKFLSTVQYTRGLNQMSASREKKKRKEENISSSDIKREQRKKEARRKTLSKILYSVVSLVLVVAVVLLLLVNSAVLQKNATAVTVGDSKTSAATFNYYYWDAYSNFASSYGDYLSYFIDTSLPLNKQYYDDTQTWADYFTDSAASSIEQVSILCAQANAAGYTLSDEDRNTIDTTISNLDTYASYYGYSNAEKFLVAQYGKGCTAASYRAYLESNYIASGYAQQVQDDTVITDQAIDEYYQENKNDFDVVTYRAFFVDGAVPEDDTETDADVAMENARQIADAMATQSAGNEDAFIRLAEENASDEKKDLYADPNYSLYSDYTYSNTNSTFVGWLFDDTRVVGETIAIEVDSGYYVLYFISKSVNDYNVVNVRHILITPATSADDGTSTDEDWAAALEQAEQIYSEWQDGDATEESFAELANEYSEDGGSNTNGGLYEGVYKGQMVSSFEDWCFNEGHKAGDSGIIQSSYGYHIMYYSGTGDVYWKIQVTDAYRSKTYSDWYSALQSATPAATSSLGLYFTKRSY